MARAKISGIYKITSPSGKFYIGSSVDVLHRFSGHKSELRNGRHHCQPLQRSADKYGLDSLSFELLCECEVDGLRELEQLVIDAVNPEYNSSKSTYECLTEKWKDPEFRRAGSERCRKQAIEWRKTPAWIDRQKAGAGAALAKLHKDPKFAAEHKIRAANRLQSIVNTQPIKEKATAARKQRMAEDMADPERWAARNASIRALLETPVLCVETGVIFQSQRVAGTWLMDSLGFKSCGHISNNLAGRCKTAYGYTWKYADAN